MSTIEKRLENNFVKWCNDRDIVPIKGPSMLVKGFPDRFFQLPNGGGTIYVEFKGSSYYDLTPIQVWWKDYLLASNQNRYFVVDTDEDLANLKKRCETFIKIGPQLIAHEQMVLERYEKATDNVQTVL